MGPLKRLRNAGRWFFYLDQRRIFTPYQNKEQRKLGDDDISLTPPCAQRSLGRIIALWASYCGS